MNYYFLLLLLIISVSCSLQNSDKSVYILSENLEKQVKIPLFSNNLDFKSSYFFTTSLEDDIIFILDSFAVYKFDYLNNIILDTLNLDKSHKYYHIVQAEKGFGLISNINDELYVYFTQYSSNFDSIYHIKFEGYNQQYFNYLEYGWFNSVKVINDTLFLIRNNGIYNYVLNNQELYLPNSENLIRCLTCNFDFDEKLIFENENWYYLFFIDNTEKLKLKKDSSGKYSETIYGSTIFTNENLFFYDTTLIYHFKDEKFYAHNYPYLFSSKLTKDRGLVSIFNDTIFIHYFNEFK